ncbi:hypothetical protein D3C80_1420190 [compost metagenome]
MPAAVQVRGDAAGSADAAGHAGQLPYALPVLLHQHAVVVEAPARQAQRDALLDEEAPAGAPLADDSLQLRQRHLARGNNLPALAAALNIVEALPLFEPFDPQNAASACTVNRLHIDHRACFQHPQQVRRRLVEQRLGHMLTEAALLGKGLVDRPFVAQRTVQKGQMIVA